MATAKHRAIDRLRRAEVHERKTQKLGREIELAGEAHSPDLDAAIDDPFDDDLLPRSRDAPRRGAGLGASRSR